MKASTHAAKKAAAQETIKGLTRATLERIPAIQEEYPTLRSTAFPEFRAFSEALEALKFLEEFEALRSDGVLADLDLWRYGLEHEVYWREGDANVFKTTYDNQFGMLPWGGGATPLQYLARLAFCNDFFADCINVVAAGKTGTDTLRVVTKQPYVTGEPASQPEINAHLECLGFQKAPLELPRGIVWRLAREEDEIFIGDLHSKNVIRTPDGRLAVIDGIIAGRPLPRGTISR